jgi:hypothetical protein
LSGRGNSVFQRKTVEQPKKLFEGSGDSSSVDRVLDFLKRGHGEFFGFHALIVPLLGEEQEVFAQDKDRMAV